MQPPLQLTVRPRSLTLILFCTLIAAGPLTAQFSLDDLVFEPVAIGLERPISIAHAGDGSGRLFIVLQAGRIVVHDGERVLEEPFLDISDQVSCCGEQGLLDIAFHPEFTVNGQFYVNYTDLDDDTIVSRFRVSPDPNVADATSEELVLKIEQEFPIHNGGQLKFGPDGYLHIATGDGGPTADPENRAQDLLTLRGKILRIDVDGEPPYSIPSDNPFAEITRPSVRSGSTACATLGASVSTGKQATCSLAMWGRPPGRRLTSSRPRAGAERTTAGA